MTSVTRTSGGGGTGGGLCSQPNPISRHVMPTIAVRRARAPVGRLLDIRGAPFPVRVMSLLGSATVVPTGTHSLEDARISESEGHWTARAGTVASDAPGGAEG